MASADQGRERPSGTTDDPVHQHGPDDLSHVMQGVEENPEEHHPPNAETVGVKRILRYSTLAAVVAMIVVGVVAFALFG